MPDERRFPIQGERSRAQLRYIPGATIPWSVAEQAYAVYARKFPSSAAAQSLERLAQRGGFGRCECAWLLAGGADGAPEGDPGTITLPGEEPIHASR